MSTPIKLWPPGGGDFIKVLPMHAERLKSQGWTEKQPTAKKKRAKNNEDLDNGKS